VEDGVREQVVVTPSPTPEALDALIYAIAAYRVDVVFTSNPDTGLARLMAYLLVENYRDVAAVVVDRAGWPFPDAMFIHVLDKERVVRRVDEIRMYNNGGRVV
jgi:hypothetical protein